MKRGVSICWRILCCCLLFSCINKEKKEDAGLVVEERDIMGVRDSIHLEPMWQYDGDGDSVQYIGRAEGIILSLEELTDMVNTEFENKVFLNAVQQRSDTVFVRIDSAAYLTQAMGSAGARGFITLATYILTEADGVEYVCFDFQEGDHAAPGLYSRDYFKK